VWKLNHRSFRRSLGTGKSLSFVDADVALQHFGSPRHQNINSAVTRAMCRFSRLAIPVQI